jgi:ribonuclease E
VNRLRDDEVDGEHEVSYAVDITVPAAEAISDIHSANIPLQQAAVQGIPQQAPMVRSESKKPAEVYAEKSVEPQALIRERHEPTKGILSRIVSSLFGAKSVERPKETKSLQTECPAESEQKQLPVTESRQSSDPRNRNRRRSSQGSQQPKSGERLIAADGEKDSVSAEKRGQQKRERSSESARGRSEGNRRAGRDSQSRSPDESLEVAAASPTQTAQDSSSEQDKPRKRPGDMKRAEPQRRRRNRGRKPETAVVATEQTLLADAVGEIAEPVLHQLPAASVATLPTVPSVHHEHNDITTNHYEAFSAEPGNNLEISTPVTLSSTDSDAGWEQVPASDDLACDTPTSRINKAIVEAKPQKEAVVPVKIPSMNGITLGGRACNDPRVDARPVGMVEITTSHGRLFSENVAPPAKPIDRIVPRASNDPRGPRPEAVMAHASGQS